ncbi:hypothetical protein BN1723_002824 [Verticillium longisporum]|uniref:Uncharacterized protein n=1 Tax=Verticillium longisporum TaxID=100787 RepID=A0A0G4M6L5_VERLO|nr:hypothetical protein HYQ44_010727 [Verticillium longisporum]CRK21709.1 hypothetical protein BN1723_002824 [Verticillium longisporum]CRK29933.1 hypothetical protein BN1708_005072 [Verticillium longisporum]
MKTSNVLAPVALLILTTPAQANIGQGAKLAFDLFGEGIGSLFVHIFGGKRDVSSIDGHIIRRDPPPGVPAFEYERCRNDISGVSVTATSPGPGSVQFVGVPASCMNLATVLIGDPVNGPYPLPCGSDCLVYNNLPQQQFDDLVAALRANAS